MTNLEALQFTNAIIADSLCGMKLFSTIKGTACNKAYAEGKAAREQGKWVNPYTAIHIDLASYAHQSKLYIAWHKGFVDSRNV